MKRMLMVVVLTLASAVAASRPAANVPRRSDAEIEATIKAKLAKSKIGKDGLRASVKNGVVTWEGTTPVMQHKGAATRMAKSAGAVGVVNHIKIGEAAGATPRRVAPKPAGD